MSDIPGLPMPDWRCLFFPKTCHRADSDMAFRKPGQCWKMERFPAEKFWEKYTGGETAPGKILPVRKTRQNDHRSMHHGPGRVIRMKSIKYIGFDDTTGYGIAAKNLVSSLRQA